MFSQEKEQNNLFGTKQALPEDKALMAPFLWGATWTLGSWCELRQGFRTFRLDRITALTILPQTTFTRTPEDYIRHAEES